MRGVQCVGGGVQCCEECAGKEGVRGVQCAVCAVNCVQEERHCAEDYVEYEINLKPIQIN
jgi:hypothetical protein